MKTAEFILRVAARNLSIISGNHMGPCPWPFRFALHRLTEQVNYDCIFDEEGRCGARAYSDKGCCTGCADTIGYHQILPGIKIEWKHAPAIEFMAQRFSPDTGFWIKDKGCSLPRELRSGMCLSYHCKKLSTPFEWWLLGAIRNIRDTYIKFQAFDSRAWWSDQSLAQFVQLETKKYAEEDRIILKSIKHTKRGT